MGLIPDASGANLVNETILSGDIGVAGNNSDNAYRVMYIVGSTSPIYIDGIKVVGGNSRDGVLPGKAAAFSCRTAVRWNCTMVILADNICQVRGAGGGAGIYVDNCTSLTINNTVICNNGVQDYHQCQRHL